MLTKEKKATIKVMWMPKRRPTPTTSASHRVGRQSTEPEEALPVQRDHRANLEQLIACSTVSSGATSQSDRR